MYESLGERGLTIGTPKTSRVPLWRYREICLLSNHPEPTTPQNPNGFPMLGSPSANKKLYGSWMSSLGCGPIQEHP